MPGRKPVRGINETAAGQHPPKDSHNFHCARARCRPPKLAYRGRTLLSSEDR